MRFIQSIPRDITVLMEFSLTELIALQTILDNMEFQYNGQDKTHVDAKIYLEEVLYPNLTKLLDEVIDDATG